jgi:hypothetical protein
VVSPLIIGSHDKLGLLEGGVREEAVYRGADRPDFAPGATSLTSLMDMSANLRNSGHAIPGPKLSHSYTNAAKSRQ